VSNSLPLAGRHRDLALVTRERGLRTILSALLTEWRYRVVPRPEATTLVLLDEVCPPPPLCRAVIPMGRFSPAGQDRLSLPLAVEDLWTTLERYFHKPPRAHIRIDQDRPAVVTVRGQWQATRIVSLSDLGTRFSLNRELVNGELLELDLELAGRALTLLGRVIYVIPCGGRDDSGRYDIGMLFLHAEPKNREWLHEFIIASYLERVAGRVSPGLFRAGLEKLRLAPGVRKALLGP
jgi:PilZ domain